MNIFIIDPQITMADPNKAMCFIDGLKEQFNLYGIRFVIVNKINISKSTSEIDSNSIVVLFNDNDENKIHENNVNAFLCKATEANAEIWPIAMDKAKRTPAKLISDKQSYDVEEQLRVRNLNDDYIPLISKAFARKIISEVMPTLYRENGLIFISHRRIDGEEITAELCDEIAKQAQASKMFRDVTAVEVGKEAQQEIDRAMAKSDVFIFIHTPRVVESEWIMKELRYAILRNIPILWVQIDNADLTQLKIKPTENPHLHYDSDNFHNEPKLIEIVDEIIHKTFELIMLRTNKIFDYYGNLKEMFKDALIKIDEDKLHYNLNVQRKGYRYPQRNGNWYSEEKIDYLIASAEKWITEQYESKAKLEKLAHVIVLPIVGFVAAVIQEKASVVDAISIGVAAIVIVGMGYVVDKGVSMLIDSVIKTTSIDKMTMLRNLLQDLKARDFT